MAVYPNVFPANRTAVLTARRPMMSGFPSSSGLANTRYSVTVRYDGMKSADPIRNIARWEKRPRGGLPNTSAHEQNEAMTSTGTLYSDTDRTGTRSVRDTSTQLGVGDQALVRDRLE
jgi:hypothetical protein